MDGNNTGLNELGMRLDRVMVGWIRTDVPQHVANGSRHIPPQREDYLQKRKRKEITSA